MQLDAEEFTKWKAYFLLNPPQETRLDIELSNLTNIIGAIVNSLGGKYTPIKYDKWVSTDENKKQEAKQVADNLLKLLESW